MIPASQSAFDYSVLDANTAAIAQSTAKRVRMLNLSVFQAIVETGRALIGIREMLPHGAFLPWINSECQLSERSAREYMQVARELKSAAAADLKLDISAAVLISAPSTPTEVREQLLERAQSGEHITKSTAKAAVQAAKAPASATVIEYVPKSVAREPEAVIVSPPEPETDSDSRSIFDAEEADHEPTEEPITPIDVPRLAPDMTHEEVTNAWMVFHSVENINEHLIPIPRMVLLAKDRYQEADNFRKAAAYLSELAEAI